MKKIKRFEGKADGGALFVVTTCMSIICLGLAFVGGDIPSKTPKANTRVVDIEKIIPNFAKDTLQLVMIKPKPADLIPTIDPKAPPLSTDKNPTPTPSSAGSTGQVVSATTNDCGGQYNLAKLPNGNNFGDPNCSFTKDRLYSLLQQADAKHADFWFLTVVPGESSYNPNARAAPVGAQLSLDAGGAWGLFQMGSSTPFYQAPPAPGKNGELDRGDINWEVQAGNAIGYNRSQSCSFRYWATAKAQWGLLTC